MGPFATSLMSGLGAGIASKGLSTLNKKPETPVVGKQAGQRQKKYFEGLYGNNLNPWEWAGAGGHGEGGTAAPNAQGIQNRKTLQDQMDRQERIEMARNATQLKGIEIQTQAQKEIAGILPKSTIEHDYQKIEESKGKINLMVEQAKQAKNLNEIWKEIATGVKEGSKAVRGVYEMLKEVNKGINNNRNVPEQMWDKLKKELNEYTEII